MIVFVEKILNLQKKLLELNEFQQGQRIHTQFLRQLLYLDILSEKNKKIKFRK